MNQIKIGKFIAECRKNSNLTQMQLAEKLNITDRAISKWENGKAMQEEQFSINSILNYYNIANELSYKILFFSIAIVLAGLLIVILSSMLILKKYRLKSEDINSVMKAIIITQIIFFCITTFFYFISYNNEIKFNSVLGNRFEWLSNNEKKKNSTENYDVKKYITDIENCYKTNFTIVLITNFSCTILEILLQKKILDSNSY